MGRVCPHCGYTGDNGGLLRRQCPSCHCETHGQGDGHAEVEEQLIDDLREALSSWGENAAALRGSGASPAEPRNHAGPDLSLPPGGCTRLGEFEILEEVGRGGMGVVYRARQCSLDRIVALKVLPYAGRQFGASGQRFRREARVIAKLNHPNIVPVYDDGESNGQFYYAMGFIDGCSLDVAINRRPELLSSTAVGTAGSPRPRSAPRSENRPGHADDPNRASAGECVFRTLDDFRHLARLLADVADGLDHAHGHGIIHRDVKPQNILINKAGRVFIADFGLSQLLDEPHLTVTGSVMGTPAYLSPEQIETGSDPIDHRTDIYSLGVTLYELIAGRRPFGGETREQILHRIRTTEPVAPRRVNPRVPRELETICLRAMDKDPGRRFPTAAAMADDLRRFAQGLPIRSRGIGVSRRIFSFGRRHRAAAAVGGLVVMVAALGAGFAANLALTRRAEADRLLAAAYDQLVYADYRAGNLVADEIERAESLGADPLSLNLVRALAELGASENASAIDRLITVRDSQPEDPAAAYLLSWAQWRTNRRQDARATFDLAESLGGAQTADDWFFRGLAAHFDRPEAAINSYRQANALRADTHQFFPQSVLHLARAYNQRMYATRTADAFADADAILRQLIEQQHYGAYPHYLLSITQRLAGEIFESSSDPQIQSRAESQYEEALAWAQAGQLRDPKDDRPITAEAECLERLGRFPEAIDARTRALAAADQQPKRCEAYHYRWRLHFWVNQLDAALADIQEHAACMPESICYAHVYPAWVFAQMGDRARALSEARTLAGQFPEDAQAILWSAACLRLLGEPVEADELLVDRRHAVSFSSSLVPPQTPEWVTALYDFAAGGEDLEQLLDRADSVGEPRRLRAEAYFHAAAQAIGDGRRADAERLLLESYRSFDNELRYTFHAKALLVKLRAGAGWPPWLGNSTDDASSESMND